MVKSKSFGKKLLALFLAVLMALTCFTGALTAYASTDPGYHDDDLLANALGWVELQDDQTLAATVDYLDDILAGVNLRVDVNLNYGITIKIDGYLDSVSGAIDLARQAQKLIDDNSTLIGMAGDAKNVTLKPLASLSYSTTSTNATNGTIQCGKDYRAVNSSKEILIALLTTVYRLTANWSGGDNGIGQSKAIIRQVLTGNLSLGIVGNFVDIYDILNENLLKGIIGEKMPSNYEKNLVFNVVCKLLTNLTDWYTDEEATNMYNQVAGYELDVMLFKALNEKLLKEINVEVTYSDGTSSRTRFENGDTDPHLFYTSEGNIYIFKYDDEGHTNAADKVDNAIFDNTASGQVLTTSNLWDFAFYALKTAWKTVLQPTLGLLDAGVKDYDNGYHKWCVSNEYGWNLNDIASNYTTAKVEAWAAELGESVDDICAALTGYARTVTNPDDPSWTDIESSKLFNELRYSPLVEYYFNDTTKYTTGFENYLGLSAGQFTTGPMNATLACTGSPNIDAFMATAFDNYDSIVAAFNDFLVAAVKDFLPGFDASTLVTSDSDDPATIATNLTNNICKFLQYICDATDANILAKFYKENGNVALTEQNIETAMIPFVISLIQQNFGDIKQIHPAEWDRCVDAEGVAYVVLKEYLSYVLPDKDYTTNVQVVDGAYVVDLEDTIIPMCRDAVGYVIAQYVPVEDGDGNYWSIYNETQIGTYDEQVAEGTDIFTLLNSVVDYYGNEKGVASLLGCVDTNGNCKITKNQSIWANIDTIANQYFPVLGELQYGSASTKGAFDSYDLIWNDIVKGILDIGNTEIHESGLGGVSNFMYRFLTILSAPSLKTNGVVNVVYDFLAALINGVVNPHQTKQTYYGYDLIPANSTNHPFHDLIQVDTIAGNSNNGDYSLGVIGCLIVNLVESFNAGAPSCKDTMTHGMCFAIQAVASFIDGFVPQLNDFTVGDADISIAEPAATAYTAGSNITNTITVSNLGQGINRFMPDGQGNSTELPRSFIKVVGATADKGSFSLSGYSSTNFIAPEDSIDISVSGSLNATELTSAKKTVVTFTISYQFVQKNGQAYPGYTGTYTKQIFLFVTGEPDWESLTYKSTGGFTEAFSPSGGNAIAGNYSSVSQYVNSSGSWSKKYHQVQYPNSIVIKTSKLDNIDYTVYVFANASSKSIDTIVASNDNFGGTDYFAVTCDPKDGALTNCNFYDYYQYQKTELLDDDGNVVTDNAGNPLYTYVYDEENDPNHEKPLGDWVTNDPQTKAGVVDKLKDDFITDYRFHHVFELPNENGGTLSNITVYSHKGQTEYEETNTYSTNVIVDRNEDGTYNAVYIQKDSSGSYKGLIQYPSYSGYASEQVTPSSGIQGIFISFEKLYNVSDSDNYKFLKWDGETQVVAQEAKDMKYQIISANPRTVTITTAVADESDAPDLTAAYVEAVDFLNSYSAADMADYANGSSATYNYFKQTVLDSVEAANPAITTANATEIGSVKASLANTTTTTRPFGDKAFATATAADLSGDDFAQVKADNFLKDGVYYQTKYTTKGGTTVYANPIYNTTPLTDAEVGSTVVRTFTYDDAEYNVYKVTATGVEVVKIKGEGDEAAVWHLANAPLMESVWADAGTATADGFLGVPYRTTTNDQQTNDSNELLYTETSFVYRDASNNKTSSNNTLFPWVIKMADTYYGIIDDAASRGIIKIAIDRLAYASELAYDQLNVTKAQSVYNNVYLLRADLNNVNFNVVKYENMAKIGRQAEALISIEDYYDYYIVNYGGDDATGARQEITLFSCLSSQFDDQLAAYNATHADQYEAKDINAKLPVDENGKTDYSHANVTSKATNFALTEAERLYNIYLAEVTERGYVGDKLEDEIICAANGKNVVDAFDADYNAAFTYDQITVDTDNNTYTVGGNTYSATDNRDGVEYTADSWNSFIAALADADTAATEGNTTYAYKDAAPYVAADKDDYTRQVSDVHSTRQALMFAENNLEVVIPEVSSGYEVTGYVGALAKPTDTYGSYATTGATITITVNGTDVTAETDNDGKFIFPEVPDGTYTATITYAYGFTRTFTIVVNGADVAGTADKMIGIVGCNWDGNETINPLDVTEYLKVAGASSGTAKYNVGIDVDRNNTINPLDVTNYLAFSGKSPATMTYADYVLQ